MNFRTVEKKSFLIQRPLFTKQVPRYSSKGDGTHVMKPHTVELNGKIMEKESMVNKPTCIYSLKETHNNKNIIVIIFVQPCFACFNVTNASTQVVSYGLNAFCTDCCKILLHYV